MFYTREEVELALGLPSSATPVDAPIVHVTYDDTTYTVMDCREYLGSDPASGTLAAQLLYAEACGADGIMVPLTRTTADKADILHVGDRGWYIYAGNEMWAHVPGVDPLFKTAIMFSTPLFAFDGTGYAVMFKYALREVFLEDRTTPYVQYTDGIVRLV